MYSQKLLRKIQFTVYNYGKVMKYYEKIPHNLPSLVKLDPTQDELMRDYRKLSVHFSHPLFSNFVPNYDESNECVNTAWDKRYIITKNLLKKT